MLDEKIAKGIIKILKNTMKEAGFSYTFILGAHLESEKLMCFPFTVDFQEDLLVGFLFNFLNMEENKELKEKLFDLFNPVKSEIGEFVRTVKL